MSSPSDSIPFLAPRNGRTGPTRGGAVRALFYQNPNAQLLTEPLGKKPRVEEPHVNQKAESDTEVSHALIGSMYQKETDKTFLQSGLEELFCVALDDSKRVDAVTLPFCSYILQRYFNISSGVFRPHQQEVCLSVLQGNSTLAVCPTGWGKSLCYQFPMLVHRLLSLARQQAWMGPAASESSEAADDDVNHPPLSCSVSTTNRALPKPLHSKFCIVVSPLLSLIADQMEKIRDTGCLKAITISAQVAAARESELLRSVASPTSDVDIIFTSPEKFVGSAALRELLSTQVHRLAMVCVDEVHCVSRWAYDFRPAFMCVSRALSDISSAAEAQSVPFLCLTATATGGVIQDIQAEYRVQRTIIAADPYRRNLRLESIDLVERQRQFSSKSEVNQKAQPQSRALTLQPPSQRVLEEALLEAVVQLPKPIIVYVHSRADADELSSFLAAKIGGGSDRTTSKDGKQQSTGVFSSASYAARNTTESLATGSDGRQLVVRCFHAALSRQLRTSTQQQFIKDKIDVLVATVAFGMGIDKPNIRSVIHAFAPSSLESYVQEIGRAGRDGLPSYCRVLYNPLDFYSLRCRQWTSVISPVEMRAIVRSIFGSPVTLSGERLVLVCPYKIAEELAIAEETVETVLFSLITGAYRLKDAGDVTTTNLSSAPIFSRVRGSFPLGYRVVSVQGEGDDDEDGVGARRRKQQLQRRAKQRRVAAGGSMDIFAASGVGSLLAQLSVSDIVLDAFRGKAVVSNQIDAINETKMSWDDFQYRLTDLQNSGALQLSRTTSSPAYLLEIGDGFVNAASPAGQEELSETVFRSYNERLSSQAEALKTMFGVLASPTHENIANALLHSAPQVTDHKTALVAQSAAQTQGWEPPTRSLSRVEAVSIANDFVEKNAIRLQSTYEAARCLLGVTPKSLIKHGKYAGQIPLALSWYVSSPYFGLLKEFDLEWVLAVLKPHQIDEQAKANAV